MSVSLKKKQQPFSCGFSEEEAELNSVGEWTGGSFVNRGKPDRF